MRDRLAGPEQGHCCDCRAEKGTCKGTEGRRPTCTSGSSGGSVLLMPKGWGSGVEEWQKWLGSEAGLDHEEMHPYLPQKDPLKFKQGSTFLRFSS